MNKGCKYCKWYPKFRFFGRKLAQCRRVKKMPPWYDGGLQNWNPLNLDFCGSLNMYLKCKGFEEKVQQLDIGRNKKT